MLTFCSWDDSLGIPLGKGDAGGSRNLMCTFCSFSMSIKSSSGTVEIAEGVYSGEGGLYTGVGYTGEGGTYGMLYWHGSSSGL